MIPRIKAPTVLDDFRLVGLEQGTDTVQLSDINRLIRYLMYMSETLDISLLS